MLHLYKYDGADRTLHQGEVDCIRIAFCVEREIPIVWIGRDLNIRAVGSKQVETFVILTFVCFCANK